MKPGISDNEVLEIRERVDAILLTADKDFGELIYRHDLIGISIILIRLAGLSPTIKAEIVANAIKEHTDKIQQAFTVITPDVVRIRHR